MSGGNIKVVVSWIATWYLLGQKMSEECPGASSQRCFTTVSVDTSDAIERDLDIQLLVAGTTFKLTISSSRTGAMSSSQLSRFV